MYLDDSLIAAGKGENRVDLTILLKAFRILTEPIARFVLVLLLALVVCLFALRFSDTPVLHSSTALHISAAVPWYPPPHLIPLFYL